MAKKLLMRNGNEVLLRGYAPGGWLLIEGYMMHESGGSVGAQHEIKENLVELMGTDKTEEFLKNGEKTILQKEMLIL